MTAFPPSLIITSLWFLLIANGAYHRPSPNSTYQLSHSVADEPLGTLLTLAFRSGKSSGQLFMPLTFILAVGPSYSYIDTQMSEFQTSRDVCLQAGKPQYGTDSNTELTTDKQSNINSILICFTTYALYFYTGSFWNVHFVDTISLHIYVQKVTPPPPPRQWRACLEP